jgi:hypothetical protein
MHGKNSKVFEAQDTIYINTSPTFLLGCQQAESFLGTVVEVDVIGLSDVVVSCCHQHLKKVDENRKIIILI